MRHAGGLPPLGHLVGHVVRLRPEEDVLGADTTTAGVVAVMERLLARLQFSPKRLLQCEPGRTHRATVDLELPVALTVGASLPRPTRIRSTGGIDKRPEPNRDGRAIGDDWFSAAHVGPANRPPHRGAGGQPGRRLGTTGEEMSSESANPNAVLTVAQALARSPPSTFLPDTPRRPSPKLHAPRPALPLPCTLPSAAPSRRRTRACPPRSPLPSEPTAPSTRRSGAG